MGKSDIDDIEVSLEMYERELKERQWIIDQCPFDIYTSGINPRYGYPQKLMSYWETRDAVAESAEDIIIDSGYRKYGDMKRILQEAERYDAEWLIPPDITPHFYCYDEISPESRARELACHLKRYESWADSTSYDLDRSTGVLLPLHRPVEKNIEWLSNPEVLEKWSAYDEYEGGLLDVYGGVAIGLKEMPVPERIEALVTIDENTPPGTHVHALSPGTEMEMLAFLRENPQVLDSLDVSTPENAPKNNKLPDNTWKQHKADHHNAGASWFPTGSDVTTLRGMSSGRITLQLNHMLSPLCNKEQFDEIAREWEEQMQTGGESQPTVADD